MSPKLVLNTQLENALRSREERLIRRVLPDTADAALADFVTNDYISLASSPVLRSRFLSKLEASPNILGSGGSRLLVNPNPHTRLEDRLASFFKSPTALLFNSGFDANVGFFSCIPQPGDVIVHDEYIHASVHDGMRASRVTQLGGSICSFSHNSIPALSTLLRRLADERPALRRGDHSVFIAVESLYSMDGTLAPLAEIVELAEKTFPAGNGYVVVDEAHATGVYGPNGRGLVAMLGLENRVLARLHTFGKALAGSGAVILTNVLIRDYLLNYARPLIYTTSLTLANIFAVDSSLDLLEDGTTERLSAQLLNLCTYFISSLQPHLLAIPPSLLCLPPHLSSAPQSLPTPIIPLMTPQPRALSAFLRSRGLNARHITWPTVPKGAERVRVCLHVGNGKEEVDRLVSAVVEWAEAWILDEVQAQIKNADPQEVVARSKL